MRQDGGLSRRQVLMLMGLGTSATAAACTCGGLLFLLASNQDDDDTSQVVYVTATKAPLSYPTMVSRSGWGAATPDHNAPNESSFYNPTTNPEGWLVYEGDPAATYRTVVIHHSVIYEGADSRRTLAEIERVHREERGWADVAYHYFVARDGQVYEGRDVRARGTHVGGYNTGSVGVCLLGDYTRMTPTEAQINGTKALVGWLAEHLTLTHLAGHRDFNPGTECPGDNLVPYLPSLAEPAGLSLGTDGYVPLTETPEPTQQAACPCPDCQNNATL